MKHDGAWRGFNVELIRPDETQKYTEEGDVCKGKHRMNSMGVAPTEGAG